MIDLKDRPDFVSIEKGSSLEEVSLLFEVDKDYLKRYHNIYCDLDDLIEKDIPKHLVKLFVPPKDEGYRTQLMSGYANTIFSATDVFSKNRLFKKEYGIVQTTFDDGARKNRISFLTQVEKKGANQYVINRKEIYINHKAPDLVAEQIGGKIGTVFFPLELETRENGNLSQIVNINDIRNRWKTLRSEIVNYYQGNVAESIFKSVDDQFLNKNTMQNQILGSLFYRLYFLPFRDYVDKTESDFDLYLPLFSFKTKVRYLVSIAEKPLISENGKMLVKIDGRCADQRTFTEMENGKMITNLKEDDSDRCKGNIKASYQFNREDGSLHSIEAEISLESEEENKRKKITFELYQQ